MPGTSISSDAVAKATGKGWDGWFSLLDSNGCRNKTHQQIVGLLATEFEIESGWWQQMVTVEYEKFTGRRDLGERQQGDFQTSASRTFKCSNAELWKFLFDAEGLAIWLGTATLSLKNKTTYRTVAGVTGELRTFKENQRARITWKKFGWDKPSTLQIMLYDKGDKCSLNIHHEQLPTAADRDELRAYWSEVLTKLRPAITAKKI